MAKSPEEAMRRVVERVERRRRGMPAPQVLVRAPGLEFAWGERGRRFHTASIGKAMTAARVFQLAERGRLRLEDPLSRVLPRREWDGLFAGDPRIEHLLTHTSGVADYFEGRSTATVPFARRLVERPDERWTPAQLLDWTRRHQHPGGAPGERFAYADTGYVLLGRIIEEAGGASLGAQLHEGIFEPSGMRDSCLLFHTMPGGGASGETPADDLGLAPLWLGRHELSRAASLTCDWGGGGVVSTLDDLVRFTTAWAAGALVGDASRTRMADASNRFRLGIRYGAGLMRLRYEGFSPLLRGMPRPVGHIGVTSTHLFVAPERDLHLALNLHSTREMLRSFRTHIELVRIALRAA